MATNWSTPCGVTSGVMGRTSTAAVDVYDGLTIPTE
jgi:hypothetical protein